MLAKNIGTIPIVYVRARRLYIYMRQAVIPASPSRQGQFGIEGIPDHPSKPSRQRKGTTTSKGLRPGWARATFIVKEETVPQIKALAYWNRKELKRVVEEAFKAYLHGRDGLGIPDPGSGF